MLEGQSEGVLHLNLVYLWSNILPHEARVLEQLEQ